MDLKLFALKMSTIIANADRRVNEATESLRKAEVELREWKVANQPLNTTHPTFVELKAEVTACRAREERAQQVLVELSKQQTAQITVERDLLLNRSPTLATMFPLSSPSIHPSEHKRKSN
jgi:hypothetical protein